MAKVLEGGEAAGSKKKSGGKVILADAKIDRELMEGVFESLHAICDARDSSNKDFTDKLNAKLKDAANDYGVSDRVLKILLGEERGIRKKAKKLKALDVKDRDALTAVAKAFEGTPFGDMASKMADTAIRQAEAH